MHLELAHGALRATTGGLTRGACVAFLIATAPLFACSSSGAGAPASGAVVGDDAGSTAGDDASADAGPPAYPAIHPPVPALRAHGGPVLTAASIVTITFEGDPFAPTLQGFGDGIGATPWWTTSTAEFCAPGPADCIGPATGGGHAVLPLPSATTLPDADLQALLQARVADGTLPDPTSQTIYSVYVPAAITVTTPNGQSCSSFHAYHGVANINPKGGGAAVKTTYAVVTRCPDASSVSSMTLLGSHELVEAATDPFLNGFYSDDPTWSATHGGESCDLCLYAGATMQGSWPVEFAFSNAAAAKGDFPCVPTKGATDFNVAPADGRAALTMHVGETKTLDLVAYSDAPLAAWSVSAVQSGGSPGALKLTLDHKQVKNGDTTKLTVTLEAGSAKSVEPFMIMSQLPDGTRRFWPGAVTVE